MVEKAWEQKFNATCALEKIRLDLGQNFEHFVSSTDKLIYNIMDKKQTRVCDYYQVTDALDCFKDHFTTEGNLGAVSVKKEDGVKHKPGRSAMGDYNKKKAAEHKERAHHRGEKRKCDECPIGIQAAAPFSFGRWHCRTHHQRKYSKWRKGNSTATY